MRKIKFRAWDKKEKRIFKVDELIMSYTTFVHLENHPNYGSQRHGLGEVELMQFTGLLDENGKEIYEGDVVEYFRVGDRSNKIGEIRFVQFGFFIPTDDWQKISVLLSTRVLLAVEKGTVKKVIGNIYENPELLEKVKVEQSSLTLKHD